MIRKGKRGDIVYLKQGYGAKCKIDEVVHWGRRKAYVARVLEPRTNLLRVGDRVVRTGGEFSRRPAEEIELIE